MNDRIPASIAAEHKQLRLTLERESARAVFSACVQGNWQSSSSRISLRKRLSPYRRSRCSPSSHGAEPTRP